MSGCFRPARTSSSSPRAPTSNSSGWVSRFRAEYFWGRAEGNTSKVILRATGWYAQADYFILPHKLDLGVRYSVVDPNRAVSNDVSTVFTAAPTWYFKGNNVKVQIDYSRTHRQRSVGAPANDQLLRLQVQLML